MEQDLKIAIGFSVPIRPLQTSGSTTSGASSSHTLIFTRSPCGSTLSIQMPDRRLRTAPDSDERAQQIILGQFLEIQRIAWLEQIELR